MGHRYSPFDEDVVVGIANALGDTEGGLTGSEIGRLLARIGIADPGADITKRHRLANALINRQHRDGTGNGVIRFITEAMAIGNHLGNRDRFEQLRAAVNPALSLAGYRVRDDGRLGTGAKASTFDEVAALTDRLIDQSQRRGVHPEVLAYCRQELIRESPFHAVSEATKGVSDRLRKMTGLTTDGVELVNACFASGNARPMVRINDWETKSEVSEHKGVADLIRGVIGTFRNPNAHTPRAAWTVNEQDVLDLFSTLSYIHRRLDGSTITKPES